MDNSKAVCELAYNPDSLNHHWVFEEMVEIPATATMVHDFKANKIYQFTCTTNITVNIFSSSASFFELGYRTGATGATYVRDENTINSTISFSKLLTANRIYVLKVTDKNILLTGNVDS